MTSLQDELVTDSATGSQPSPAAFAKARALRPEICGSDGPERPYPIYLRGLVERGFGRGGKDLGCPTANLPSKVLSPQSQLNRTGIYFGFARVLPQDPDDPDLVDADEELDNDAMTASGSNGHIVIDRPRINDDDDDDNDNDDPRDEEWEVDEEEVVLAASPTSTEGSTPISLAPARAKSRQLSKSSTRSNNRNTAATLMEQVSTSQADRSSLDIPSPASKSSSGMVAMAGSSDSPLAKPEPKSLSSDAKSQISPIDTQHANSSSSPPSHAGSLRRRKKRRVQIAEADQRVFPMVMSVGWNPFYKNTTKTAEVHIMHPFEADFYGLEMRVVVLGYIRPEFNYISKEALVEDIEMDKKVAINSLARTLYQDYSTDPFLLSS